MEEIRDITEKVRKKNIKEKVRKKTLRKNGGK